MKKKGIWNKVYVSVDDAVSLMWGRCAHRVGQRISFCHVNPRYAFDRGLAEMLGKIQESLTRQARNGIK